MLRRLLFLAALLLLILQAPARAQNSSDAWRASIRSAFDIPAKLPPLDTHRWSTFSPTPGVLADRVTYSTADGMIVPAIVYRPDPKLLRHHEMLPGIVIVNGHGSDKFGWYAFYSGIMFAKAGAVVVTYDPIGEGERNDNKLSRQTPSPHDAPVPEDIARRLAGLMQVDLMQAVSYLDAQLEVDPRRIAVAGYSMGAFIAGITGAVDPRIHALVLSGGGTYDDGPGYFDANKNPCQGPPYRALLPLLGPHRGYDIFVLNAERGPTFVMNGLGDTVMDIHHHDAAWFETMRSRVVSGLALDPAARTSAFTFILYPETVSHRPSWVNRDGVHWLNGQVHFAFWNTNARIDAQGTTHISNWITKNSVDISPNYFREDREGGLEAVGSDIPAIPRASLMVLPEADWFHLKDQLTYEAWAAKVKPEVH
jgi:dienelactone hydrolase